MSIGENVREIRKRLGLTQSQLAELAEIQLTQVSRIENNDTDPKASTLKKLMTALKCSADDLMSDSATLSEEMYVKRALKKISKLSPLDKHSILNVIDSFCRGNNFKEIEIYGEWLGASPDWPESELSEQDGYARFQIQQDILKNERERAEGLIQEMDELIYRVKEDKGYGSNS